jgi:hypothetical protein
MKLFGPSNTMFLFAILKNRLIGKQFTTHLALNGNTFTNIVMF